MNDFEKQLTQTETHAHLETNSDEFIVKLHSRIHQSNQNRNTFFVACSLIFLVGFLSITQIGAPEFYPVEMAELENQNYFETDLWTVEFDSLLATEEYTSDLAYFLIDEGDLWDTLDLLNEIELEEERTL